MAVYEIQGQKFEVPDEVQGQQLEQTLTELSQLNQAEIPSENRADMTAEQATPFTKALFGEGELPPGATQAMGAETAPGILEPMATVATGAIAEPIAGLTGLATLPFQGSEQAEKNIEAVRQALTFIPRTQEGMQKLQQIAEFLKPVGEFVESEKKALGKAGFEATGEPLFGALGETAPAAVLELSGLGIVRRALKSPKQIKAEIPDATESIAESISQAKPKTDLGAQVGDIKSGIEPEAKTYEQILSDLKNKNTKRAAEQVMPDEDIMKAADDLNIDLNPSHYSNNRAFIDLEQSLKSRPGSKLATVEEKAIKDLGDRADTLIADIGGITDKSLLDAKVKSDIDTIITDLESKSDIAYKAVNEAIPREIRVKPLASKSYLDRSLRELGGNEKLLSTAEKQLLVIMDKNPTYAALDRIRKNVGDGFRKNSGPFKDDDKGTLKQVYKVLSEDQQGVADAFGVGADYSAARRLVRSRKEVEDSAIRLLGRETQGSIVPKINAAATKLTKGDISDFRKLMKSLPETRRQEVAASLLNDIFAFGSRTKGPIGQGFVNAFKGLNRNKEAKAILFKELPPGAEARFNKIGKVAEGIFKSKALENTSKTARDLISAMDDGGLFGKVYDTGRKVAIAEGVSTSVGIPGAGTAAVMGAALSRRRTPATVIADEFITSKKFKDAIEQSARTGNAKKADEILKGDPKFNKWLSTLDSRDVAQIMTVGFIPWVTGQTEVNQ